MECCSAIKRNEVGTHATTWINLENITLMTEARHIVYDSIYMKHPEKANPQKNKLVETESRLVIAMGCRKVMDGWIGGFL